MRSVFNCHPDAVEYIAQTAGCSGSQALRCAQLYGFLEHMGEMGRASTFNQSVYAKKMHITRETIQRDLMLLTSHNWINVQTDTSGTDIDLVGLPFKIDGWASNPVATPLTAEQSTPCLLSSQPLACSSSNPLLAQQSTSKNSSKKSYKKTTNNKTLSNPPIQSDQREQIMQLWNENKHSKWKSLYVLGLRDITVEHISSRIGGIDKFIEYLPLVLQAAAKDKYWGKPGIGWNQFMGTGKTGKANFESFIDVALANQDTKQNSAKFEKEWRVRRDIVNGEIRCIKPNMTKQEIAEATQNLDRQNENPIEPKSKP